MGATLTESDKLKLAFSARPLVDFFHNRLWMAAMLVLADLISLVLVTTLAVGTWFFLGGLKQPELYWGQIVLALVFVAVYALRGLYPAVGVSPVNELRRLTVSTAFIFLGILAFIFYSRQEMMYSRAVLGLSFVFAILLVPAGRFIARSLLASLGMWGEPAAIIGCGPQTEQIITFLQKNRQFGLIPKELIKELDTASNPSVGCVGTDAIKKLKNIQTAILVTPEIPPSLLSWIVDKRNVEFPRIILVSRLNQFGTIEVTSCDIGGILGLEVGQNLLNSWQKASKRLMDIFLVLLGGIVVSPLLLLITLLVKLTSKGKLFYSQTRIGEDGRSFKMWKFRTMVADADQVLEKYLHENPILLAEWEANFKLKDDPRITSIGGILRKLSLDELPQLWNVLKGEMSLVGPRPIVKEEIERYDDYFHLYTRVKPGITGMWQVSGRSDIRYGDRVHLDDYYVRNWSLWLDIFILVSTLKAVLTRQGAC